MEIWTLKHRHFKYRVFFRASLKHCSLKLSTVNFCFINNLSDLIIWKIFSWQTLVKIGLKWKVLFILRNNAPRPTRKETIKVKKWPWLRQPLQLQFKAFVYTNKSLEFGVLQVSVKQNWWCHCPVFCFCVRAPQRSVVHPSLTSSHSPHTTMVIKGLSLMRFRVKTVRNWLKTTVFFNCSKC